MLESFGTSDPGCVRSNNEDSYFSDGPLGLYLVADGMGGAQAGETASQMAVETVVEYVRGSLQRDEETLIQAFSAAHRSVLQAAASMTHLNGMGTTLIGVLEVNDDLQIASVGDSRAYLFENGQLQPITEDQTWANEMGRRIGLDDAQLRSHPMRHVLTMAIGVEAALRVNSYLVRPAPGCTILLCSDGLHGVLQPDVIAGILGNGGSLDERAAKLIAAAREAGGPDNVTVLLLRKSDDREKTASGSSGDPAS
ncbi:MAG: protein phosphatase 2C domain-containing protein [Bryobacteraceae bacterium]